jgi:hypothetical protein
VGIYLHDNVVPGARPKHFLDIDFVAWPPLELAPGHVADDGGMRIGDGLKQALRLRPAVQLKAAIDARDHKIKRSSMSSA